MITLNFDEVLKRIYNAKKGVEVRYGLGQGFEYCKQFADEAQGYATNANASEKKASDAVANIDQQKADSVAAVQQAQTTATASITQTKDAALTDIGNAKTGALQEVANSTATAETAASAAAGSASDANASKEAAATSAAAAAASASAASASETNSSASESAAQKSAEEAAASAALAGTRAGTDKTLSIENAPADAKATGDALAGKLSLSGGTMTGPIIMPGGGSVLSIEDNAATHNMVYRGKALGTSVTSDQWAAIEAGTFKDLYLGDYWSIGGVDYIIAAFDYWLNTGDTVCDTHHIVVIPRSQLYTYSFNPTSTTEGGYVGSDLYKNGLTQAKQMATAAFGSAHILSHRECLVNAATSGAPTGVDWYDSTVELMNENMVYGGRQFSPMPDGSDPWQTCWNATIDKSQLPLFHLAPWLICSRQWYWLRDVVSGSTFASINNSGESLRHTAATNSGVRPVVGIC